MQPLDSSEQRELFRDLVIRAVGSERHTCDARTSWEDLMAGNATIVDAFHAGEVSYLVLTSTAQKPPLSSRTREALELALRGVSHKALAIELGVAPSTVASMLKCGLARLGLGGLPSRVPLSLLALAQAATLAGRAARGLGSTDLFANGRRYEVISVPQPSLANIFPPAVRQVVALHAEGKSYAEIAARRSTSTRTVANQLASAFHRLRVSGRTDLLSRLLLGQSPSSEPVSASA